MRDLRGDDGLQLRGSPEGGGAGEEHGQGPLGHPGSPPTGPGVGAACGKAILVGEHFVVHGGPALAVPLSEVTVTVSLGDRRGEVPRRVGPPIGLRGVERMLAELGLADRADALWGLDLEVSGALPLGVGLGGSAALAAALVRALEASSPMVEPTREADALALAATVHRLERIAHGTPSGLDGLTVVLGRPIWLPAGAGPVGQGAALTGALGRAGLAEVLTAPADTGRAPVWRGVGEVISARSAGGAQAASAHIPLTVAVVPRHGSTREAVAKVASWQQANPGRFMELLAQTAGLAERAKVALADGDLVALGRIFDEAHEPLRALGLPSPEQERLIEAARRQGAHGAKMSGAGLGGAVIAVGPEGLDLGPVLRQAGAVQVFSTPAATGQRGQAP